MRRLRKSLLRTRAPESIFQNVRGQLMNRVAIFVFVLLFAPLGIRAQEPKPLPAPDDRYKADILLVVAHPDDEGAATPYLARAIYDEHKRVAVVFTTRGGSGG